MNVLRLTPPYAERYRALMLEAYALHPEAFTSSAAERAMLPLSWWQKRLEESSDAAELVIGAASGEELLGVAGLSFEQGEKVRHKATLFGMYVPERHRRLGLGRQLVQAALGQARGRPGVRLVRLTVTQGNAAAETLYRECGFVPFGEEPLAVAVGEGFVTKLHMWCDLRPVP